VEEKMKKLLMLFMVLVLVAISAPCFAEETAAPNLFNWDFGVSGDLVYLMTGDVGVHPAIGLDLATVYEGVIKIRALGVYTDNIDTDLPDLLGIGAGVDVKKAIERSGGTWVAETVTPTVGVVSMLNLSNTGEPAELKNKMHFGFWVSLISVKF
jgi:hypothetical protein